MSLSFPEGGVGQVRVLLTGIHKQTLDLIHHTFIFNSGTKSSMHNIKKKVVTHHC